MEELEEYTISDALTIYKEIQHSTINKYTSSFPIQFSFKEIHKIVSDDTLEFDDTSFMQIKNYAKQFNQIEKCFPKLRKETQQSRRILSTETNKEMKKPSTGIAGHESKTSMLLIFIVIFIIIVILFIILCHY